MTARKAKSKPKREPSPREVEHARAASDALEGRRHRTEAAIIDGAIASPHADERGFSMSLMNALGTASAAFMLEQVSNLSWAGRRRNEPETTGDGLNASLAIVQAVAPANELEAALAVQMAGVHSLAAELLGRAKQTDRVDHIALYGGLAVKLTRTFAVQAEALAKLRGGGKQQVEVRHVYVNGNAVIGNVGPGGGGAREIEQQPHAPCPALPEGTAVWRAVQTHGVALQGAGDQGQASLPNARRA